MPGLKRARSRVLLVGIAYLSFIALGVPGGFLGVAWPSMMRDFDLSLDAVGVLLVAFTVGSLLFSFASGPAISRFGSGRFLAASSFLAAIGLLGLAVAPVWWATVLFGVLAGAAAGGVDSALNVFFAENHGSRLMNWLHACFGLGATLGPVLMTALLRFGSSWRWGYAGLGVAQVLVGLCFVLTERRWRDPQQSVPGEGGARGRDTRLVASLRLPVIWLSVSLFLLSAGAEAVAGQWPYSLFTESRGVDPTVAGLWISVYWGALTASRILYGIAASRLRDEVALRLGMLALVVGAALLWTRLADTVSLLGLALMGFAVAPILPLLHLMTPQRVGSRHTANAIGLQTAAGYLGAGVLPALAGWVADRRGLETVGPFLLVSSVVVLLLHEVIVRRHPVRRARD